MAFKDSSKGWFRTSLFPTQEQFYQVFDWLRWKDEQVAIADVAGLSDALNNSFGLVTKETFTVDATGHFAYTIPAGCVLNSISLFPTADGQAYCTSANGIAGDLVPADLISASSGIYWLLSKQVIVDTTIVITSLPGTILKFIKTKII